MESNTSSPSRSPSRLSSRRMRLAPSWILEDYVKNENMTTILKLVNQVDSDIDDDFEAINQALKVEQDDSNKCQNENSLDDQLVDELMWEPNRLEEDVVKGYLKTVELQQRKLPIKKRKYREEQALLVLSQCDYDVEKAIERIETVPKCKKVK